MPEMKVLTQDPAESGGIRDIDGVLSDGRVLTDHAGVAAALGWDLKPEGLCRGDVCVPVRDPAGVVSDDGIDLAAVAGLLGMSTLVDEDAGLVAVSAPAGDRRAALVGRQAPNFVLPDLDGNPRSLEQFKDRKRLLIAFASW
jgi:hypothetical protein